MSSSHGDEADGPGEAASRRRGPVRLGLATLLATGRTAPDALEPVVRVHRAHHPRADLAPLVAAYRLAATSHRGQVRKSGEPFITHPLAVTMILAELGAETTTLTAALLHDTVEDTDVTLEQVADRFGSEVAYLVDGVTKLEKVDHGAAAEPETFRKMLVATGNDVRVMVIKLADRLHNMRTIRHMKRSSQVRIATVTRDVLIPLADRLGVQILKTELEDIVFATLHPEEYARTRTEIERHRRPGPGAAPLERFAERVRRSLRLARVPGDVRAERRHCVSVHRLRLQRGAGPLAPYDFGRLVVIVPEDPDCYTALGALHGDWRPVSGAFRDFVAAPKFNLYQALHTTLALDGGVLEVLIRSRRMHRIAEYGVVALGQWEPGAAPGAGAPAGPPEWLARLLDWQRRAPDPDTFWTSLTAEMSGDGDITVYTAGGRPLALPNGASGVDAAYALGEETGHRCIGVRRGGELVGLSAELCDGDTVEVLTEPGAPTGPVPEWLACARTPRARIAIERWLAEHGGGSGPLADPFPGLSTDSVARAQAREHAAREAAGRPARGGARGSGRRGGRRPSRVREQRRAPVAVPGRPAARARLARCCTPVPPDPLTGFAIRGGAVAVHRAGCPEETRMRHAGRAALPAVWQARAGGRADPGFRVTLHVEALSRRRLLADLTEVLCGFGVGIVAADAAPPDRLRVRHTYTVELSRPERLPALLRSVRQVPGVYDVHRDPAKSRVTTADHRAIIGGEAGRPSGPAD